ncbi:hypothetical protein TWF481_004897 [Arthrobotrys musiformis]|uniref:Uncharacterized protein n=1 Tax=Arthrobotrys musiformis TaxID=47236 RepID=A0AAV9WKX4_9PEZI
MDLFKHTDGGRNSKGLLSLEIDKLMNVSHTLGANNYYTLTATTLRFVGVKYLIKDFDARACKQPASPGPIIMPANVAKGIINNRKYATGLITGLLTAIR